MPPNGRRPEPRRALVVISGAIPARYRDVLSKLVGVGFAGVDQLGVEVHLRSRPPRTSYAVRYEVPLSALSPSERDRLLAAHPGAAAAPVIRHSRRRRDAEMLAAVHHGDVERRVDHRLGERMSGCAYYSLPAVAKVSAGTRYLVTLKVPRDLDALTYPVTLQYHHGGAVMTTAPRIEVRDWREEFVHLVAHEAFHTVQFDQRLPKSEVAAERWAQRAVLGLRAAPALALF